MPVAKPLVIAVIACLPLLACKREAPPTDATTTAPAASPDAAPAAQPVAPAAASTPDAAVVPPPDTTYAVAGVQPPDSGVDTKAIVGTFKGKAPCADCPGIDTTLVLAADGSYTSTNAYRDRGTQTESGAWSAEDGRILLNPTGDKTHTRRLEPIGTDALQPLGADGKPVDAPIDMTLRRSG